LAKKKRGRGEVVTPDGVNKLDSKKGKGNGQVRLRLRQREKDWAIKTRFAGAVDDAEAHSPKHKKSKQR